jgi:serine/threonine protein phosphatase 1
MIQNKKYKENKKGIDYVVGDLHGCFKDLDQELNRVNFDKTVDRLFSVGDLADRGFENMECLSLINQPWFYPVRGNHEDMLIDSVVDKCVKMTRLWFINGGSWSANEKMEDLEYFGNKIIEELPLTISLITSKGKVGISHAQPPCIDWDRVENDQLNEHEKQTALWARSLISFESEDDFDWDCKNVDLTIHGHTPVKKVCRVGNAVFIDTGSFIKVRKKDYGNLNDEYLGVKVFKIDDLFLK